MTTKTEAWWVGVDRETFYQRLRERQPDMQKAKDIYITAKDVGSTYEQLYRQKKERRG